MKPAIFILFVLFLALACGGGGSGGGGTSETPDSGEWLVATLSPADFSIGIVSMVRSRDGKVLSGIRAVESSDLLVKASGDDFFVLHRFGGDLLERSAGANPGRVAAQYDLREPGLQNANPHDLVEISETEAYLLRYESSIVWRVNPSAEQSSFYKSDLSLAHYDDGDGSPELTRGCIAGNNAFFAMQRLSRNSYWNTDETSFLAVVNTQTHLEVNTGQDASLPGIPLPANNPQSIHRNDDGSFLYLLCAGDFGLLNPTGSPRFNGGVVRVDSTNYSASLLLDDGPDHDATFGGNFFDMTLSGDSVFVVVYKSWKDSKLIHFKTDNPSQITEIPDYSSKDIRSLNTDSEGRIWIGLQENNQGYFHVIDSELHTRLLTVPLDYFPVSCDFVILP